MNIKISILCLAFIPHPSIAAENLTDETCDDLKMTITALTEALKSISEYGMELSKERLDLIIQSERTPSQNSKLQVLEEVGDFIASKQIKSEEFTPGIKAFVRLCRPGLDRNVSP